MPIDYSEYHPKWTLISRLIRFKRALNHCEFCGIENGLVIRKSDRQVPHRNEWERFNRLKYYHKFTDSQALVWMKFSRVVLTVAHLDHDKTNNKFSNLAALCQKCHLNHDITHHNYNRKYGRKAKSINHKINFGLQP